MVRLVFSPMKNIAIRRRNVRASKNNSKNSSLHKLCEKNLLTTAVASPLVRKLRNRQIPLMPSTLVLSRRSHAVTSTPQTKCVSALVANTSMLSEIFSDDMSIDDCLDRLESQGEKPKAKRGLSSYFGDSIHSDAMSISMQPIDEEDDDTDDGDHHLSENMSDLKLSRIEHVTDDEVEEGDAANETSRLALSAGIEVPDLTNDVIPEHVAGVNDTSKTCNASALHSKSGVQTRSMTENSHNHITIDHSVMTNSLAADNNMSIETEELADASDNEEPQPYCAEASQMSAIAEISEHCDTSHSPAEVANASKERSVDVPLPVRSRKNIGFNENLSIHEVTCAEVSTVDPHPRFSIKPGKWRRSIFNHRRSSIAGTHILDCKIVFHITKLWLS